jgi:hypothetical protein
VSNEVRLATTKKVAQIAKRGERPEGETAKARPPRSHEAPDQAERNQRADQISAKDMEIEIARIVLRQPFDEERRGKEPVEYARGQVPDHDPLPCIAKSAFSGQNPQPPTVAWARGGFRA